MFEFPVKEMELQALKEDNINLLISLDENGLILGVNEDVKKLKERLTVLKSDLSNLNKLLSNNKSIEIYKNLQLIKKNLIQPKLFLDASKLTERYSFNITWAPGFFAEKAIGLFTGGFTLISDTKFPIFILRSSFAKKIKWMWYNRAELLAHELCHVARSPLNDDTYEEFFAYNISFSNLRKYIGSCFKSPLDSILILIPFLILLIMELIKVLFVPSIPMIYFWIISFIYPCFLLIKNHFTRKSYFKAKSNLKYINLSEKDTESTLFRCTAYEIKEISKLPKDKEGIHNFIHKKVSNNLRWNIIFHRFFKKNITNDSI